MTVKNQYQKDLFYIPFKQRYLRASYPMIILMGIMWIVVLVVNINAFPFYACITALITLAHVGWMHKTHQYFLKTIWVSHDQHIHLLICRKDQEVSEEFKLSDLNLTLKVLKRARRSDVLTLEFFHKNQLIVKQRNISSWEAKDIKDVFLALKALLKETLTSREAKIIAGIT